MSGAFTVRTTTWGRDRPAISSVREPVFVIEQKIDAREEFDAIDPICDHILAQDNDGRAIGTGRIDAHGKIGRIAVLSEWRRSGVGRAILKKALELARDKGFGRVYLFAQVSAMGFYEREGFSGYGDRFSEAGIEHRAMERRILDR